MFDAHCAFVLRVHSYRHDSFVCLLSCFVLYFFGISSARIHKTVFWDILLTRIDYTHTDTQTHRHDRVHNQPPPINVTYFTDKSSGLWQVLVCGVWDVRIPLWFLSRLCWSQKPLQFTALGTSCTLLLLLTQPPTLRGTVTRVSIFNREPNSESCGQYFYNQRLIYARQLVCIRNFCQHSNGRIGTSGQCRRIML